MKVKGVPPHATQLKILDLIKSSLENLTSQFEQQSGRIIQTVKDAIYANDLQSGTLNLATLENKLNEHMTSVEKIIQIFFKNNNLISTDVAQQVINRNAEKVFFAYDGKFYGLPKDFQFPKNMHLKQAWSCWRQGFPKFATVRMARSI